MNALGNLLGLKSSDKTVRCRLVKGERARRRSFVLLPLISFTLLSRCSLPVSIFLSVIPHRSFRQGISYSAATAAPTLVVTLICQKRKIPNHQLEREREREKKKGEMLDILLDRTPNYCVR